jgi:hypothetical protein
MSGGLQPTGGQTAAELCMPAKLLNEAPRFGFTVASLRGALFFAFAFTCAYVFALSRLWKGTSRAAACWMRAADDGLSEAERTCGLAAMLAGCAVPVTRLALPVEGCAPAFCATKKVAETTLASTATNLAAYTTSFLVDRCRIGVNASRAARLCAALTVREGAQHCAEAFAAPLILVRFAYGPCDATQGYSNEAISRPLLRLLPWWAR